METAAEIEALLKDGIDGLFAVVIFPNYGKITSDGVTLGPTWWSQKLEAQGIVMTPDAIRKRVERRRSEPESGSTTSPTPVHKVNVRGAKSAIRRHPELARDLIADPAVATALAKAQRRQVDEGARAVESRRQSVDPPPSPVDLLFEFRQLHKGIERLVGFVHDGRAVVNEGQRDALLTEVEWLKTALDVIESGLKAGSLDKEIARYLEGGL